MRKAWRIRFCRCGEGRAQRLQARRRLQLIVLSGPNMAGKSTFIRSVGVNAVLAQAGAPVRAARLRLSPLTVAASICVLDSLSGGVSRFYAEIHRVKLIFDLAEGSRSGAVSAGRAALGNQQPRPPGREASSLCAA
jgi:hypothetical protein